MSDRQADPLRIDVLGRSLDDRTYLALKNTHVTKKSLKKLEKGSLVDGCDPLHLRIVRNDQIVARAKLGQVNGHEVLHIVSTEPEPLRTSGPGKHRLLEGRMRILPQEMNFAVGDIIELESSVMSAILLLADARPVAIAEMVEYRDDAVLRIVEVLDE